jgi:1-acyl-sn-glycerol-3-phosphate acyltransferase
MIYLLKLAAAYIVLLSTCLVGFILSLFRPFNPSILRPVGRFFGALGLFFLGIKTNIEGEEILNTNRPAIIVSNHQDNIDVFVIGANYPHKTVTIGKNVLKWIPFFGQFYWLAGNILIDRSNKRKALHSMNKAAKKITKSNTSVWIFPEGTRSNGRGLLNFKKGAYHLAIAGQIPVIPVSISSFHKNLDLNSFKRGEVLIKVHNPIETKGLEKSDIDKLLLESRSVIEQGIEALDKRLAKSPKRIGKKALDF